jgi:hypothetical protein
MHPWLVDKEDRSREFQKMVRNSRLYVSIKGGYGLISIRGRGNQLPFLLK